MSNQYFPPIPGQSRGRGRPSLEEMTARKAYWQSVGGPPNSVQPLAPTKDSERPAGAPVEVIVGKKAEMIEENKSIPEDIQKIIDSCQIPFTKEDNKTIHDFLSMLPPSKRGRPSKEDQDLKETIKKKINSFIVAKIKSTGGLIIQEIVDVDATISQKSVIVSSSFGGFSKPGIKIHQFNSGDQVRLLDASMEKSEMGIVSRHDIGSTLVFVLWRSGVRNWRSVQNLIPFKATKEEIMEFSKEQDRDKND